MKTIKIFLLMILVNFSCNDEESVNSLGGGNGNGGSGSGSNSDWLIPQNLVFDGGPGKDGIPALVNPDMKPIGNSGLNYLEDDDLLVVYKSGNDVRAYSQRVMDWHEIINDKIGDDNVAITYCPLTGTAIGWGREINGKITTFGVSGLLYETNLMPYDRLTDSYWNQMENKCVNGELIGEEPEFFSVVQMSFAAIKVLLPDALINTSNTGFSRNYARYPYGSYKDANNTSTLFPISVTDTRLAAKEVLRGVIIDGDAVAYRFPDTGRTLITDNIAGQNIVVVADRTNDMTVSFLSKSIDTTVLEFTLVTDDTSPIIMEDQLGNKWDMFGTAVEGPNVGEQLEVPYSYMGYWFSFPVFFPDVRIYGQE